MPARHRGGHQLCSEGLSRHCHRLLGCFPAVQPLPPAMDKCSHKPQAPSCSTVAVMGTGTKQYGDMGWMAGSQPAHPRMLAASFLLLEPVIRDPSVHTGGDPTPPLVTYKCLLINKELHHLLQDPGVTWRVRYLEDSPQCSCAMGLSKHQAIGLPCNHPA